MPSTGSVRLFDARQRSAAIDALVRHPGEHVVFPKATGHLDALRGGHRGEARELDAAHVSCDFALHRVILRALPESLCLSPPRVPSELLG
jgi:hypothetical protein